MSRSASRSNSASLAFFEAIAELLSKSALSCNGETAGCEPSPSTSAALLSLLKKLKYRPGEANPLLDQLHTALSSKGTTPSDCVTIPRTDDGRMQLAGKKRFPHVLYCQIFRWPGVHKNELRHVPACRYGYDTAASREHSLVCVNPHHYERGPLLTLSAALSGLGEVDAGRLRKDSTVSEPSCTMDTPPALTVAAPPPARGLAGPTDSAPAKRARKHSDRSSVSEGFPPCLEITPPESPQVFSSVTKESMDDIIELPNTPGRSDSCRPRVNAALSPLSGKISVAVRGLKQDLVSADTGKGFKPYVKSASSSMSTNPSDRCAPAISAKSPSNGLLLDKVGSVNPVVPRKEPVFLLQSRDSAADRGSEEPRALAASPANFRCDAPAAWNGLPPTGSGYFLPPSWWSLWMQHSILPSYFYSPVTPTQLQNKLEDEQFRALLIAVPIPEHWCCFLYYELDQQIGDIFDVPAADTTIYIDGHEKAGHANQYCLGLLTNPHRSEAVIQARRLIDDGIELATKPGGDVWLRCLSPQGVYLQSYSLNCAAGRTPGDAVHMLHHRGEMKIFDLRQFVSHMKTVVLDEQPDDDDARGRIRADLHRLGVIRLSFAHTFATPRQPVERMPCWIEIRLKWPHRLIEAVIRDVDETDTSDEEVDVD
ncbi:mothers against decapentaplegic homolog 4-like [Paramacrobiotus metropolitanus]|uniref:mothers against decapentaplegic homolog 4-like n=1 Tax=Paramacrobiotus metropolitanus TaxID=2943436 RepID=UPI0024462F97|nr:mothers against decapentaplegic homolog 4-like [Paramacrobiotus metropolitanus]